MSCLRDHYIYIKYHNNECFLSVQRTLVANQAVCTYGDSPTKTKSPTKLTPPHKSSISSPDQHPVYLLLFETDGENPAKSAHLGLDEDGLSPRMEEILAHVTSELCKSFPSPTNLMTSSDGKSNDASVSQRTRSDTTPLLHTQSSKRFLSREPGTFDPLLCSSKHASASCVKVVRSQVAGRLPDERSSSSKRSRFIKSLSPRPPRKEVPRRAFSPSTTKISCLTDAASSSTASTGQAAKLPPQPSDPTRSRGLQVTPLSRAGVRCDRSHRWRDPKTNQTFETDPLTGFSSLINQPGLGVPGRVTSGDDVFPNQPQRRRSLPQNKPLTSFNYRGIILNNDIATQPEWITSSLSDYRNPVFGRTKGTLKTTSTPMMPNEDTSVLNTSTSDHFSNGGSQLPYKTGGLQPTFTVASQALGCSKGLRRLAEVAYETIQTVNLSTLSAGQCHVIGQADHKFIIVLYQSELLLLFDQHAVHERIRVESYFAQLLAPNMLKLKWINSRDSQSRPTTDLDDRRSSNSMEQTIGGVPLVVDKREYMSFRRWQARFRRWGIIYRFESTLECAGQSDNDQEFEQIFVTAVPELICTRLERDVSLLENVLRSCAAFFDEHIDEHGEGGEDQPERARVWFNRLSSCPPILVELINSKACRGTCTMTKRDAWMARLTKCYWYRLS